MGSGPFRNSVDGGGGGIVAGTPGVARLVAGRNPQRTKAVVGHAISKHVVESMQRLFEARGQRASGNATSGEATLATLSALVMRSTGCGPRCVIASDDGATLSTLLMRRTPTGAAGLVV